MIRAVICSSSVLPGVRLHADLGFLFDGKRREGGFADVYLQFAFGGGDVDFAAFGDVGEQDTQTEWDSEQTLNGAAQGPRSLRLAETFFAEQVNGAIVGMEDQALFKQTCCQFVHL